MNLVQRRGDYSAETTAHVSDRELCLPGTLGFRRHPGAGMEEGWSAPSQRKDVSSVAIVDNGTSVAY